jgi:hypothetical protein
MPEPQAEPEVKVQPAELEPEHAHAGIADDDEFTDHACGPAAETELGLLSAGAMNVASWLGRHASLSSDSGSSTGHYSEAMQGLGGTDLAPPTLHINPAVVAHAIDACSSGLGSSMACQYPRAGYVAAGWVHGRRRSRDDAVTELQAVHGLRTVDRDINLGAPGEAAAIQPSAEGIVGLVLVTAGAGVLPPAPMVLSKIAFELGGLSDITGSAELILGLGVPFVIFVLDYMHTVAAADRGSDGADCEAYTALLHNAARAHAGLPLSICTLEGAADFTISDGNGDGDGVDA